MATSSNQIFNLVQSVVRSVSLARSVRGGCAAGWIDERREELTDTIMCHMRYDHSCSCPHLKRFGSYGRARGGRQHTDKRKKQKTPFHHNETWRNTRCPDDCQRLGTLMVGHRRLLLRRSRAARPHRHPLVARRSAEARCRAGTTRDDVARWRRLGAVRMPTDTVSAAMSRPVWRCRRRPVVARTLRGLTAHLHPHRRTSQVQ